MSISREQIDNEFKQLLDERLDIIEGIKTLNQYTPTTIDYPSIRRMGYYIDGLKPKSKYREPKQKMLTFLEILVGHREEIDTIAILKLKEHYLGRLCSELSLKHEFSESGDYLRVTFFSLLMDGILILVGLGQHYYYIPVITICRLIRRVAIVRKAKREGKYIVW